jgi:hypothetical protein
MPRLSPPRDANGNIIVELPEGYYTAPSSALAAGTVNQTVDNLWQKVTSFTLAQETTVRVRISQHADGVALADNVRIGLAHELILRPNFASRTHQGFVPSFSTAGPDVLPPVASDLVFMQAGGCDVPTPNTTPPQFLEDTSCS